MKTGMSGVMGKWAEKEKKTWEEGDATRARRSLKTRGQEGGSWEKGEEREKKGKNNGEGCAVKSRKGDAMGCCAGGGRKKEG